MGEADKTRRWDELSRSLNLGDHSDVQVGRKAEASSGFFEEETVTATVAHELTGQSLGNYIIKERIGEGGMGAVYRAEHPLFGKHIAVKVILREFAGSEDILKRFEVEARASSSISSEHVPRFYDFGSLPDGRAFVAMDLLQGETLAERLARDGSLPWAEAVEVLLQVAHTLSKAHASSILHRDVKPENLFLAERADGVVIVKLLDFGIAKLTGERDSQMTQAGAFLGSPLYCAPEQAVGDPLIEARADIYALGATMFELLHGKPPFAGAGGEVLRAKITRPAPSLVDVAPHVPTSLALLVDSMLQRNPDERPQTMLEVVNAADRCRKPSMTSENQGVWQEDTQKFATHGRESATNIAHEPERSSRMTSLQAALGVLCLVLVLVVLGVWLFG